MRATGTKTATEQRPSNFPEHYIPKFLLIALLALIFGYVLPATVAASSGLFSLDKMKTTLDDSGKKDVVAQFVQFTQQKKQVEESISATDKLLRSATEDQKTTLLNQLEGYSRDLAGLTPVSIQPYNGHIVSYFWPVAYLCFGCVAFLFPPTPARTLNISLRSVAIMTLAIYGMLVWALWLRNFVLRTAALGRVVYAYSNVDISPAGFIVQNLNFMIMAALLAVIWDQWLLFYRTRKRELDCSSTADPFAILSEKRFQTQVSQTLLDWQVTFVLVSIAFMFFTGLYWHQVIRNQDRRFLFEAIFEQILWILTLIITARPFLVTWHWWQSQKLQAFGELLRMQTADPHTVDSKLAILRELRPIGSWNIAASWLTVISSLVAPVVHAFVK